MEKLYKVKIDSYDVNGYGVAKIDNKVIFVKNALENEEVMCKITKDNKKYCFAETVEVLTKSKNRLNEECIYASTCGGCDFFHLTYEEEKRIKYNKVTTTLKNVITKDTKINNLKSTNKIYAYRNKVMLPFKKNDNETVYGFYEKGSHNVISIDKCLISSDVQNKIAYIVARYLSLYNISIYDEEKHKGIFRELMIRTTSLNEIMVVFVLTTNKDLSFLIEPLKNEIEGIKSIIVNINDKKTNVVLGDKYYTIYGTNTIKEDILGLKFDVSAPSFMQINHEATEILYSEAINMASLNKSMNVIDAYCGMGSITLNIAKHVNHVYGIEIVEDAIKNANNNMINNNILNATFICGKCEEEIKKLVNLNNIDAIFFDPPRKGCDIEFLNTVISMKIKKIVYISCGIASLARDLSVLINNGYILKEVTPVELFPRTNNIETIAYLELVK